MTLSLLMTRWRRGAFGALLLLTAFGVSAEVPKRVLVLDPFGRNVAPFATAVSSFKTTLARELGEPVDIYELPLELARLSGPEGESPLVTFLEGRLQEQPVDLVVPVGGAGLQFAARNRERLFPNVPVLVLAAEPRTIPPEFLRTNAALVAQKVNLPNMVEDILQLQPQTTNIVVVFGASALERYWTEQCRREFEVFTNRVGFAWMNDLRLDQILKNCAALPPRSFILHVLFIVDAAGVPCEQNEALRRLHEVANAPVFGYFTSEFGQGSIGGRLFQDTEVGVQAAHTAVRILRGERPERIPVQIMEATAPIYDWRELQRWGISEARLPAGSTIEFRQPGFWERYHWLVMGTILFCMLQAGLIVGLLVNRANRKRADERFRLTVEASPNGIVLVNQKRQIVLVNTQTEKLFGYSRAELIGQTLEILLPERFRGAHPDHVTGFLSALQARAMGAGRELFGRRKDGAEFPVEIGLSPMQSAEGVLVLAAIVDITARRQSEAELLRQRAELAHVARVSTMGELAAALAHELNQPLGAILANAEAAELFLNQAPPALDELHLILADIRKDDERAGEVIRRMRALLRKRELQRQSLEINSLVEDVLQLVSGDAALRNISLTADLAPILPKVAGDHVHLQQVLLNLFLNGMDAMADQPRERRRISVQTRLTADGRVVLAVSDSGHGLAPDKLPRLFEPFYTTKPNGMGMGLSISRSIIDAHHGRIWGENNDSGGATFRISLPAEGTKS